MANPVTVTSTVPVVLDATVVIPVQDQGSVSIEVTTLGAATVYTPEVSNNGTTWRAVGVVNVVTEATSATIAAAGFYQTQTLGGASQFRLRRSTVGVDATVLTLHAKSAPSDFALPGTGALGLGKVEDAAHASGDVGVMALSVRQNTAAALAGADADYQPLITDGSGRLHIAPAPANTGVDIGDVDVTSVVPGTAATNLGKAEDGAHSSGDVGVMALAVANEAQTARAADSDYVPIAVTTEGNVIVAGNLAHNAVNAGAPVQVGGEYARSRAVVAAGDRTGLHTDRTGRVMAVLAQYDSAGDANAEVGIAAPTSDAVDPTGAGATGFMGLATRSAGYQFNGTTWERVRGTQNITIYSSAARTAAPSAVTQTNYSGKGLFVYVNVTAIVDTPSVTFTIEGQDSVSSAWYTILASTAITGSPDTRLLRVYPGLTAVANLTVNDFLPRTWRVTATHGDADSITYSVGASVIL